MEYDPQRPKVIRHAGLSNRNFIDQDTSWEWDGERWMQLADGSVHVAGQMIHDSVRDQFSMRLHHVMS
jgi:hypothetical protein